jgi:hypothetical protein
VAAAITVTLLARARSTRARLIVAGALVLIILAILALVRGCDPPRTIRLVAAGDMACDPDDPAFLAHSEAEGDFCRQDDVSSVAAALAPDVFLGLGDFQYELPTADAYHDVYGPSWGRLRNITIPVYGNQEYRVQDAKTFTDYFGNRIRDQKGYWSQNVGRWHVVVLNSNCAAVGGGCSMGSPQQKWLEADLADNRWRCVLAAWHHPRWSNGIAGPDSRTQALYQTLYNHGVELVLSGHDAQYERFGPLSPDGRADPRGVRQFVVGVGGQAHYEPGEGDAPWREKDNAVADQFVDYKHHGVLELDLLPDRWKWKFHALDAGTQDQAAAVVDEGEQTCS